MDLSVRSNVKGQKEKKGEKISDDLVGENQEFSLQNFHAVDLIQEAKLRTVWWILCIFAVTYFLTHTSKLMLMNIPMAILLVSGLRILLNEVEFKWKNGNTRPISYLSYLEKKQLSLSDSRVSSLKSPQEWKKKIDSPIVEAAIEEFLSKILHDFVTDLWYSDITPDKEAPELIHDIVMDAIGEVSLRIKDLNLVDLLLSDVVDLVGDHLDLFRRNQASIGTDIMGTLSSEERDERLKQHLMASKELHPALISSECEYKVIQQLMDGFLAVILRPKEAKCPLVRCIARELATCLVMQPIMNFASPVYINELIEYIILVYGNGWFKDFSAQHSTNVDGHNTNHIVSAKHGSNHQGADISSSQVNNFMESEFGDSPNLSHSTMHDESLHPRHADWAKVCEAVTLRRDEVLTPENLENLWAIGRDYKKTFQKKTAPEFQAHEVTSTESMQSPRIDLTSEMPKSEPSTSIWVEDKPSKQPTDIYLDALSMSAPQDGGSTNHGLENTENQEQLFIRKGIVPPITKSYSADVNELNVHGLKSSTDMLLHSGVLHVPKLRCRVIGASFEKLDSNSFAGYAICVIDANNTSWFVKRRYRNFEKLHRRLKDIPNYSLHLPPKRIFSSSTEDAFVHQRCIQLDKYLQDLLSIANVAEQHEVWDFLSASSKNYSVGTSPLVVTTLAVHVDNAMDDIVRQYKGASNGLLQMVSGLSHGTASSVTSRNVSWNADDLNKLAMRQSTSNSFISSSDNEEGDKDVNHGGQHEVGFSAQPNGWDLDNELKEDPTGVPPEWAPANLSVPVLNLVDKVFQLERRGWLRRQVFWISKQILQLVMEDAIDDWLLRQIQWLRREDVISQGIRWVQDILWPDGIFFVTLRIQGKLKGGNEANQGLQTSRRQGGRRFNKQGSFQQQLEAARRASDVKNMIFNGAPAPLVSLIGHKQYRRCARDIYYFLQSTVCLKQLGYGIVELVLLSNFPELHDLVRDIHEKMHVQPS
ncbi:Phox-associated domain [Striga asiatica]|uniref:Phox-associated domain n=1 Tax=Striga asiatica TaxID=4170 RepID=A0A5A7R0E5_STRAF|nr:Phox-associated domain [Striga asiatica]